MAGVARRFFFFQEIFFFLSYVDEGAIRITSLKYIYIYIYKAPNIVLSAEETDIWSLPLSNLQFSGSI